jgi:uncharacterized protein YndB with AHSA1/START domain
MLSLWRSVNICFSCPVKQWAHTWVRPYGNGHHFLEPFFKQPNMSSYNWDHFSLKIAIDAPIKAIYDAWTVQFNLEKWLLRKAVFHKDDDSQRDYDAYIQEGDTYRWLWHGRPDDVVEKGKVLEANGVDRLAFSFTAGALVTVTIGEAMGHNIVLLKQENMPTDEASRARYHLGCLSGWTFYLTNLKSVLEGGLDLRNKSGRRGQRMSLNPAGSVQEQHMDNPPTRLFG